MKYATPMKVRHG